MIRVLLLWLLLVANLATAQTFPVQNLNVLGQMQFNGNPGAAGSVAVSNGSATPFWAATGNGLSTSGGVLSSPTPVVYNMVAGDNTAGLQAAINSAVSQNVDLKMLGNGTVSGNLQINGPIKWYGAGTDATFLTCSTTTVCITVNTALAVDIHGFLLGSSSSSGTTSQTLIKLSPGSVLNQWSLIHDMQISAGGIGIDTGGAAGTQIYHIVFSGSGTTNATMVFLQALNVPNCNGGEFRVHDNYFIGLSGAGQKGVLAGCVGGAYIQNNKFVDVDLPIEFNFPNADATGLPAQSGDLFIQGNSIELFATNAVVINSTVTNPVDTFSDLLIQHNEIKFPTQPTPFGTIAFNTTTSHVQWLSSIQINNNDIGGGTSGTNILVVVNTGKSVDITHNNMSSSIAGTIALLLGSDVSGCTVGPNLTIGPGLIPNTGFGASSIAPTCTPSTAPF